jgi:chromosome segregation ATPase
LMESPMKSPAQGLEKLASELRQERQKCTTALQDRAKQKIEIERLKQQLQDSQADLANTEENYSQLTEAFAQLERNVGDLEATVVLRDQEIVKLKHLFDGTHEEVQSSRAELANCVNDMENVQSERDLLRSKVGDLESMLSAKNDLIHELEEETTQLKRINELHGNRLKEATYELNRRSEELDTVRRESVRAEALSSSYTDLQQSSDEVRSELEQALERNAELSAKLRETQDHGRYGT